MEREELRALMRRIEKRKEEVELLRTLVRHEESHRNQDAAFAPCERTLCYALCESLTADIARLTHEYQGLLFKLEREGEVKHGPTDADLRGRLTMTEQREQCCGNCWWWMDYVSRDGGRCCRDGSDMLASEGCSQWEQDRRDSDDDQDEEDDNNGP